MLDSVVRGRGAIMSPSSGIQAKSREEAEDSGIDLLGRGDIRLALYLKAYKSARISYLVARLSA